MYVCWVRVLCAACSCPVYRREDNIEPKLCGVCMPLFPSTSTAESKDWLIANSHALMSLAHAAAALDAAVLLYDCLSVLLLVYVFVCSA
jgi:hypothetical protein